MDWSQVVNAIKGVAPIIGSLFGPAGTTVGALASAGIGVVATALGVEPTQDAITAAISADPLLLEKLKEFEMNHKVEMEKLAIQRLSLEITENQNARDRQIKHEQITGKSDLNLYVLAWVVIGGFFGTIIAIILLKIFFPMISLANDPMLSLLLGSLSTDAGMVVGYFFGSSRSSQSKDEKIYNSIPIECKDNVKEIK